MQILVFANEIPFPIHSPNPCPMNAPVAKARIRIQFTLLCVWIVVLVLLVSGRQMAKDIL